MCLNLFSLQRTVKVRAEPISSLGTTPLKIRLSVVTTLRRVALVVIGSGKESRHVISNTVSYSVASLHLIRPKLRTKVKTSLAWHAAGRYNRTPYCDECHR